MWELHRCSGRHPAQASKASHPALSARDRGACALMAAACTVAAWGVTLGRAGSVLILKQNRKSDSVRLWVNPLNPKPNPTCDQAADAQRGHPQGCHNHAPHDGVHHPNRKHQPIGFGAHGTQGHTQHEAAGREGGGAGWGESSGPRPT